MHKLLEKFPIFITLLTVLLFSHAESAIERSFSQSPYTITSPTQAPDASNDTLILRSANMRLSSQPEQPPAKDPLQWPLAILTIASLIQLSRSVRWIPRGYLSFDNHRIAGWHDSNLQFRFIHSR
ncbi:hypothetical protein [Photobacterium sanguinicancri]|uniref:hypothetical protein n=1 Tax=Photobacterium sanguinicancri TaxID=875932 RepID=UPI0021C33F48|nr:hypothetical protein [Photobacterium sanguinicancri]